MDMPEKLHSLRKSKGLTLQQLADKSGIHYVTVHRAEKGSRKIGYPVVQALACALDVSVDDLLEMDAYRDKWVDYPKKHKV